MSVHYLQCTFICFLFLKSLSGRTTSAKTTLPDKERPFYIQFAIVQFSNKLLIESNLMFD